MYNKQRPTLLTPSILNTIHLAQKRELRQPILLFLAGHRPLAFIAGQLLHLTSPLGAILGIPSIAEWATLFSDPKGPALLEQELSASESGTKKAVQQ